MAQRYLYYDDLDIFFDDDRVTYDGLVEIVTRRKKLKLPTVFKQNFDIVGKVSFLSTVNYNIFGRIYFIAKFIYDIIGKTKFKIEEKKRIKGSIKTFFNNAYKILAIKVSKLDEKVDLRGFLQKSSIEIVDIEAQSSCILEDKIKMLLGDKFDFTYDTFMEGSIKQELNNDVEVVGKKNNTSILVALDLI